MSRVPWVSSWYLLQPLHRRLSRGSPVPTSRKRRRQQDRVGKSWRHAHPLRHRWAGGQAQVVAGGAGGGKGPVWPGAVAVQGPSGYPQRVLVLVLYPYPVRRSEAHKSKCQTVTQCIRLCIDDRSSSAPDPFQAFLVRPCLRLTGLN